MDGALRSFDKSYKGAGLALIVEILTGPLVGASFTGFGNTNTNWGNLVLVIDPELLGDRKEFMANVAKLGKRIKELKKITRRKRNIASKSTWKQTYSRTITIRRN